MSDAPNNERRWVCAYPESEPCGPGDWDPNDDPSIVGCGYVDAAPVPSPVPSRPDTAQLRNVAQGYAYDLTDDGEGERVIREAADWIDAHPATDQGPDLSELLRRMRSDRCKGVVTVPLTEIDSAIRLLADRGNS